MNKKKKLISVWDANHNKLAETISFKLVCDDELIDIVKAITLKDDLTTEQVALELGQLLERSIHLNLPRSHRFWRKNSNA